MKNVLAAQHRGVLEGFVAGDVLLAFDYDGTLAPIMSDRTRARMRPTTRRLLAQAARRWPCAIISGRARASVAGFMEGVPVRYVIGNHGAEWPGHRREQGAFRSRARAWKCALAAELHGLEGVEIEDKAVSLAVHYREAPDKRLARGAIARAARRLEGCRVVPGIDVFNLVPLEALHKGQALLRLLEESGCSAALYIGDDVTDEDVFALKVPDQRILGVRVGRTTKTRAQWFVPDQQQVDELLRRLVKSPAHR